MSDEIHVHVHAPKGAIVHVHVHESDEAVMNTVESDAPESEKVYIPLPCPTPYVWPLPSWQPSHDYRQPPPGYVGDWPYPYTVTCITTNSSEFPPNGSTVLCWTNERKS